MSISECKLCKGSCKFCDGTVTPKTGRPGRPRLYCCQHCRETQYNYREARPERPPVKCEICTIEVPVLTSGRPPKYCGDDCRAAARRQQAAEMEHFYKTIWHNEATKQRIFGRTYEDYMKRFNGRI